MKKIKDIQAVILAGGKSSRMGEDKSLMAFDRYNSMAELQYDKLSQIFEHVFISAKTNKFDFLDDSLLIKDSSAISSPMVALEAILQRCDTQKVFIITVDIPLVTIDTIQRLIDKAHSSQEDIVFAQDSKGNNHVLCGVFDKNILSSINELLTQDIHKINYLIKVNSSQALSFDDTKEFSNINTKEEYFDLHQKK